MLNWMADIQSTQPIAHGVIILCLVAALGTGSGEHPGPGVQPGHRGNPVCRPFLCSLRLQSGAVLPMPSSRSSAWSSSCTPSVCKWVRGSRTSLRRQGLSLNLLAAGVVLLGVAVTVALCMILGIDLGIGAGIFAGATTNTPALGAAQAALQTLPNITGRKRPTPPWDMPSLILSGCWG